MNSPCGNSAFRRDSRRTRAVPPVAGPKRTPAASPAECLKCRFSRALQKHGQDSASAQKYRSSRNAPPPIPCAAYANPAILVSGRPTEELIGRAFPPAPCTGGLSAPQTPCSKYAMDSVYGNRKQSTQRIRLDDASTHHPIPEGCNFLNSVRVSINNIKELLQVLTFLFLLLRLWKK